MQCPRCQTENPPRASSAWSTPPRCRVALSELRDSTAGGRQVLPRMRAARHGFGDHAVTVHHSQSYTPKYLAEKILHLARLPSKASASRSLCGGPDTHLAARMEQLDSARTADYAERR